MMKSSTFLFLVVIGMMAFLLAVATANDGSIRGAATVDRATHRRRLDDGDDGTDDGGGGDDDGAGGDDDGAGDDDGTDDQGGIDIDLGAALGLGCFSERATVQVENKGRVTMRDLQVGDRVQTSSEAHDYETVYAFGHHHTTKEGVFRQIFYTAAKDNDGNDDAPLEMTGEHLVYLSGKAYPVRADSLRVGDTLANNGRVIRRIETITRSGLYAPFTPSGKLMVDGNLVSSYISLQEGNDHVQGSAFAISQHDYVHMGLSPMRLLCMGISSHYCNTTNNDEGLPFYAAWSIHLNLWANRQTAPVKVATFAAIMVLTGTSYAMESIFGPSQAPLAVFSLLAVYLAWRKRRQSASSSFQKQQAN